MKKIDFHCHIYHPKEYQALQSWMTSRMLNPHFWMTAPAMSPSVLKSIMNETGFDYCVNLPVARIPKNASIDDSVKEKNNFAEEINNLLFSTIGFTLPYYWSWLFVFKTCLDFLNWTIIYSWMVYCNYIYSGTCFKPYM